VRYIQVKWKHDNSQDPILIYSEIDDEQWEHRKVEVFQNGRRGFADETEEAGGSRLGLEPWPDLMRLGTEPEFEIAEISAEEFEQIWAGRRGTK
jgi:hypothetical protein